MAMLWMEQRRERKRGEKGVCFSTLVFSSRRSCLHFFNFGPGVRKNKRGNDEGVFSAHLLSFSSSHPSPLSLHFPPFKHSPHCLTGGFVHLICFLFQTFQSSSPFNCNPSPLTSSPHLLCFTTMLLFHKSTTSSWTDCLLTLQQQNKKSSLALVTAVIAPKSKKEKGVASLSTLKRIGDK